MADSMGLVVADAAGARPARTEGAIWVERPPLPP